MLSPTRLWVKQYSLPVTSPTPRSRLQKRSASLSRAAHHPIHFAVGSARTPKANRSRASASGCEHRISRTTVHQCRRVTRSISRRRFFRSLVLVERIDVPREATLGRAWVSWLRLRRRRRRKLLQQLQLLFEQLDLLPKVSPLNRRAARLGLPPVALPA